MRRESSEKGSASAATAPSDPTRLANPNNPGAEGVFKNQSTTQLCRRETEAWGGGGWRGQDLPWHTQQVIRGTRQSIPTHIRGGSQGKSQKVEQQPQTLITSH